MPEIFTPTRPFTYPNENKIAFIVTFFYDDDTVLPKEGTDPVVYESWRNDEWKFLTMDMEAWKDDVFLARGQENGIPNNDLTNIGKKALALAEKIYGEAVAKLQTLN